MKYTLLLEFATIKEVTEEQSTKNDLEELI